MYGYSVNGHSLKDEQLTSMLGKNVELNAEKFTSGEDQLLNPVYKTTPSSKFANPQIKDLRGLKIPKTDVVYVQVTDRNNPTWFADGNSFYVVNHDLLLLDATGVFVQMTRE